MTEWLFERGIGEDRAVLVENGRIAVALTAVAGRGVQPGAIVPGRLRGAGVVELEGGEELLLDSRADPIAEGAAVRVLVTREALPERGKAKRARGRVTSADAAPAPSLYERLAATGLPIETLQPHGPDRLEDAGWGELQEEAETGIVAFARGELLIALTPAMTLIDIDGEGPVHRLAVDGLQAAAGAIRRHGISGNIGIDVPTLADKAQRTIAAAAFGAAAPRPFEATAINGFGFLQLIRPRERASLLELAQLDPVGWAARALLRRAQRAAMAGGVVLTAAPPLVRLIEQERGWIDRLERELGGAVRLQSDPELGIGAGHVHPAP